MYSSTRSTANHHNPQYSPKRHHDKSSDISDEDCGDVDEMMVVSANSQKKSMFQNQ
jgi:hypothetical protein